MSAMREVSVSQGLMLELISTRLCEKGGPHYGSPDKHPAVRLAMIDAAGELAIPFTTGILIGIGETRAERIGSLLAIAELNRRHGHIQEVIIQNFRAKADTRMARAAEPAMDDLLWTTAVARLILGPQMNIQSPPNLSYDDFPKLLSAGINDWGGVSPVTPDFVNPKRPGRRSRAWRAVPKAAAISLSSASRSIPPTRPSRRDGRRPQWLLGSSPPPTWGGICPLRTNGPRARTSRYLSRRRPSSRRWPRSLDRVLSAAAAGNRLEAAEITRLLAIPNEPRNRT